MPLYALPMDEVIAMAHDVTASRIYDVLLTSSTVAFKEKRRFVMHHIGHYHELVDDRIGSRVGDNCWAFADPYLKEKIARSVIPHERVLVGSFYGKFFARNLNLHLLQRNSEQWKTLQAGKKPNLTSAVSTVKLDEKTSQLKESSPPVEHPDAQTENKRKRKVRPADEIDQLFEEKLGKKVKKAELKSDAPVKTDKGSERDLKKKKKKRRKDEGKEADKGLDVVLGAIKAAPKTEEKRRHKKKS
ncbi:hypothetical protein EIP86_003144 [Pleurotus ostreatoroseus]|nr:hypothetical protein EIP86_003144 [Pleurotus ostreatoroseus]